jgi:hypothetical protein
VANTLKTSRQWGRWLDPLVRVKRFHVAIATVAARAQGVEVAETLIVSTGSEESMLQATIHTLAGRNKQP